MEPTVTQMLERIYEVIADWHPVMIWDVLDCMEQTTYLKKDRCCPLCQSELEIEEDEIWDFGRIYQKWYYGCTDKEQCWFFTQHSSSAWDKYYEHRGIELKGLKRDFCAPDFYWKPISEKLYNWIADYAYVWYEESIINYWKHKRKPIDEQSDECIKFIYDLLPTK